MFDLVAFEDLAQLDGPDLRAVFGQVSAPEVLDALAGSSLGLRRQFFLKFPAASAHRLEADLESHGPVGFVAAREAQRALVEALCRLSRGGQVAFDDPADLMDLVA